MSRGIEETLVVNIATILARRDWLLETQARDGRLHIGSERELEALRWVLSDCISNRYPTLLDPAQRVAEDFARRRELARSRRERGY